MSTAALKGLERRPSQPQLLGLFVALLAVIAPLVTFLPPWIPAVAVATAAWRWLAERFAWRSPPLLYRLGLVLAATGGVLWHYRTLNGVEAGTALLTVMLALKLLEARRLQGCVLILLLAHFLILAGFLHDPSIAKAAYLLPQLLILSALLLHFTHEGPLHWHQAFKLSLPPLALAVPLAVVLFVLFPRIPGPLWGIPPLGASAVTAMPDTLAPGTISQLAQSKEIAFRVKFDAMPPPTNQRYWRGALLHDFDGRLWSRGWNPISNGYFRPQGSAVSYEITLEPHRKNWLFVLAMPTQTPGNAFFTADYRLLAKSPVRERRRYRATSHTHYTAGLEATDRLKAYEQRLPEGYNPRALKLARQWREETETASQIINKALTYFNREPFVYTLQPPRLGKHTVDEFLFDTRRGFCEHYASAFTVLMRAAGIPARVVLGYQGGEHNPLGDYFIVRQSDAHAWSEVWLENRGWIRVDPTGAVAPDRIAQGLEASLSASEPKTPFTVTGRAIFKNLGLAWDTANNAWNQWFLGYGPQVQRQFLAWLGMENPDWTKMITVLIISIAGILLGVSLGIAWQLKPPPADPARQLYDRFCRKLAHAGLPRKPSEGPLDYARRVSKARPQFDRQVFTISCLYSDIRYCNGNTESNLQQLKAQVKGFRV